MPSLNEALFRHVRHHWDVAGESQQLYLNGGNNLLSGLELFDCERAHLEAAFEFLAACLAKPREESVLAERRAKAVQGERLSESAVLLVALVDSVRSTVYLRLHPREHIRWLEAQRAAESDAA